MTYSNYMRKKNNTSASSFVPGREAEQTKLSSGAVVFLQDKFAVLRKALIMGTVSDTFYNSKFKLTREFEECIINCAKEDGARTADIIKTVSDEGLSIRVDSCIFALVVLSVYAPTEFYSIANKVVRTLSHFHLFTSFVKEYRGFGTVIQKFGKEWFLTKDNKYLTYQFLKFNQRNGWSVRDQLRKFRPNPGEDETKNRLFAYATGKSDRYGTVAQLISESDGQLDQIGWYEWLKNNPTPENTIKAVEEGRLTHEMVAPLGGMSSKVWSILFKSMPMTATIRNLANLSSHRVFDEKENLILLDQRLNNKEALRQGRIHPYQLLLAGKVYRSGGRLLNTKSEKTWDKIQFVENILDDALALSFDTQEPTNQTYFLGIDVSSSMTSTFGPDHLITSAEVAALMALITARTEKFSYMYGFFREIRDLGISAKDSFQSALARVSNKTFGSTNVGAVYDYAMARKLKIDTFAFYTDCESWGGTQAYQKLNQYRRAVNPLAKAVYVSITARNGTLADPKDFASLTIGGFDPQAPRIIGQFSQGLM